MGLDMVIFGSSLLISTVIWLVGDRIVRAIRGLPDQIDPSMNAEK